MNTETMEKVWKRDLEHYKERITQLENRPPNPQNLKKIQGFQKLISKVEKHLQE